MMLYRRSHAHPAKKAVVAERTVYILHTRTTKVHWPDPAEDAKDGHAWKARCTWGSTQYAIEREGSRSLPTTEIAVPLARLRPRHRHRRTTPAAHKSFSCSGPLSVSHRLLTTSSFGSPLPATSAWLPKQHPRRRHGIGPFGIGTHHHARSAVAPILHKG